MENLIGGITFRGTKSFGLYKFIAFLLSLMVIGLPILQLWEACALFVVIIALLYTNGLRNNVNIVFYGSAIILLLFIKHMIPSVSIQEGHNLYLPPVEAHFSQYTQVPKVVREHMNSRFLEYYPESNWCKNSKYGCWRYFAQPSNTFAFSADSIWQNPFFSRVVSGIDFNSLSSFRGGFVNNMNSNVLGTTNWYDGVSNIKRLEIPYFVMYILPKTVVSSQLCWRGDIFWELENETFSHIESKTTVCQLITDKDIGKKIIGVGFPNHLDLKMSLNLSPQWQVYKAVRVILVVIILMLIVGFFTIDLEGFAKTFALISISLIFIGWIGDLSKFSENITVIGGGDGLTYKGYGRHIAFHLSNGNVFEALRGLENVFYYMPGMRYFRAVENILFGDTDLGYFSVLLAFYTVVGLFLLKQFNFRIALILFGLFLLGPMLPGSSLWLSFSFNALLYHDYAVHGFSETLGYGVFILGVYLILKFYSEQEKLRVGWLAVFLLAIAVIIRPNTLFGAMSILGYSAFLLIRAKRWKTFLQINSGFIALLLVPLHNYIYGHKLVLLTSAANINVNYPTPPGIYLKALNGFFSFSQNDALSQVTNQLSLWISSPIRLIFLLITLVLVFNSRNISTKLVMWAALGLHIPLLFWTPNGRYADLAWFLTFLGVLLALRDINLRYIKYYMQKVRKFLLIWNKRHANQST